MSTTFAPVAKLDDVVADVRAKAEAFGSTVWGRAFTHLLHVTGFIALVIKRDHTVLPLAAKLDAALGTALGGVPADAIRLTAASFDGLWTLVLRPFGL